MRAIKQHRRPIWFIFLPALLCCLPPSGYADTKVIAAEGTYTMGDGETPLVAESRALQQAKRVALEEAGTYVQSYAKTRHDVLTDNEIEAISAGLIEVEILEKRRQVVDKGIQFYVKIKATVTLEKADELVTRLRQRDLGTFPELVQKYGRLRDDHIHLAKEMELLKQQMAEAKSTQEIQQTASLIAEQERRFQARELYDQCIVPGRDTNDIIGCLTDVIRFDPRFAEAWAIRGFYNSYLLKHEEQAISDYTEAIRLDPQPFVYVARGEALLRIGKQKRAIADASEALRRDSDEWEAWTILASAHFREHKYANTINDATNAIERNLAEYRNHKQPARHEGIQLAYLFSLRGFAYKKLRQPERAFADLNESLRITDELVKAHPTLEDDRTFRGIKAFFLLRRGVVSDYLGRLEEARHDFQQACALGEGDGCRLLEVAKGVR